VRFDLSNAMTLERERERERERGEKRTERERETEIKRERERGKIWRRETDRAEGGIRINHLSIHPILMNRGICVQRERFGEQIWSCFVRNLIERNMCWRRERWADIEQSQWLKARGERSKSVGAPRDEVEDAELDFRNPDVKAKVGTVPLSCHAWALILESAAGT
jgi:hypothetical protein